MEKFRPSRRQVLRTSFASAAGAVVFAAVPASAFGKSTLPPPANSQTIQAIAEEDPIAVSVGLYDAAMTPLIDGYLPSTIETRLAFLNLATVSNQAKATAMQQGIDVDAFLVDADGVSTPKYNWSVPSYDSYVALEMSILPTVEVLALTSPSNEVPTLSWHYILSKVLAALGIKEAWEGILKTFDVLAKDLLMRIAIAIKNKSWALLKKLIGLLLDLVKTPAFLDQLGKEIGTKLASKIIGEVLADALPVVGWGIVIGQFVWAVAEQYVKLFTTSVVVPSYA